MLRLALISFLIAVTTGFLGFGLDAGTAFPLAQWATFLFTVLFLIFIVLGLPAFRNLV